VQADIGDSELMSLALRGDRAFERLSRFFERSIPTPVYIEISPGLVISRSFSERGAIAFPVRVFRRNAAIIAHEMTHLFMPENHWEAFREGIAVYAQDRFGDVVGYPNYGEDLDKIIARRFLKGVGSGVRTFSEAEAFFRYNRGRNPDNTKVPLSRIDPEDRRNAYLLAGSFTRYVFEVVLGSDMTAFKRIFVQGRFEAVVGTTLSDVETAWLRKIGADSAKRKL